MRYASLLVVCVELAGIISTSRGADTPLPDYQAVSGWMKLPAEMKHGPVSAVATDSEDRVFVFHRGKNPILVFDRDGKYLRSWGDDTIKTAHGLRIDNNNNVWVSDICVWSNGRYCVKYSGAQQRAFGRHLRWDCSPPGGSES